MLGRLDSDMVHLRHLHFFGQSAGCRALCTYAGGRWHDPVDRDLHELVMSELLATLAGAGPVYRDWKRHHLLPFAGLGDDVLCKATRDCSGDCDDGQFFRRHHLPDHGPAAAFEDWLRVDGEDDRFHQPRVSGHCFSFHAPSLASKEIGTAV